MSTSGNQAHLVGHTAGVVGTQGVGHAATQAAGLNAAFNAGRVAGQAVGLNAGGQHAGQTVTHTSAVHRSAEFVQNQPTGLAHRGDRHRRASRSTSSSSGSVDYRTSGAGGAAYHGATVGYGGTSHQSHSTEGGYHYGGATGGYNYGGAAGGYNYGAAPCGYNYGSNVAVQQVAVGGPRRPGRHQKQVIRLPDQPQGPARQIRRRLPTPEPDILERVYIQRTAGEVVEEITEIPTTPPPRVQEKTVVEPAGPPQVIRRTIRVPPRSGGYASNAVQSSGHLLSAGSYGNVQQAAVSQPQYSAANASFSSGYSAGSANYAAPRPVSSGYGAATGGYGAATGGYGAATGGYGAATGGYGASTGGYGAATGGYGATTGGYGASTGGYGAATGGYGAATGGYGAATGGYGAATGGYGAATGGYGATSGGYGGAARTPIRPPPGFPPTAQCFVI